MMELPRSLAENIMSNIVMRQLMASAFRKVIGAKRFKNKAHLRIIQSDLIRQFGNHIFLDDFARPCEGFHLLISGRPFGSGSDSILPAFELQLHDELRIHPEVIEFTAYYTRFMRRFFVREDLITIGTMRDQLCIHDLTPPMFVCSLYAYDEKGSEHELNT